MPMVFVTMALRANIREWAILTCSGWRSLHRMDPTLTWDNVKALELATYEQDLAVANAFQFLAVWSFGQAVAEALTAVTASNSEDRHALMQAGVLGVHAFVVIGLLRSVVSVCLAAASSHVEWQVTIVDIQGVMAAKVDPMFLFATVLCVLNMLILGKMTEVKKVLGKVNNKFNATRALLIIGQGQMMVLTSATTENPNYEKIMKALHHVPGLENLSWNFNIDQARLLHSSLLCFECLIVALVNLKLWDAQEHQLRLDRDRSTERGKSEPLLD